MQLPLARKVYGAGQTARVQFITPGVLYNRSMNACAYMYIWITSVEINHPSRD